MKTIKYFAHCETLDALKAEYKRLARIHHPDAGGDDATMLERKSRFRARCISACLKTACMLSQRMKR